MIERIKERYAVGFVTEDQLARYVAMGVISEDDLGTIRGGAEQAEGGESDTEIQEEGDIDTIVGEEWEDK